MGTWHFDDDFADVETKLREGARHVVQDTIEAIANDARAAVPVNTGALKASLYVSGPRGSSYGAARGEMLSKRPGAEAEPEYRLDDWSADDIVVGVVDSAAPYAPLIHDGFHNWKSGRHIAGRPFLANALRGQQDEFHARIAQLLKALGCRRVNK